MTFEKLAKAGRYGRNTIRIDRKCETLALFTVEIRNGVAETVRLPEEMLRRSTLTKLQNHFREAEAAQEYADEYNKLFA